MKNVETIIKAVYKKDQQRHIFINVTRRQPIRAITWSFRYVNPDKAALAYVDGEEGENNSFLIESNVYATGTQMVIINIRLSRVIWQKLSALMKLPHG